MTTSVQTTETASLNEESLPAGPRYEWEDSYDRALQEARDALSNAAFELQTLSDELDDVIADSEDNEERSEAEARKEELDLAVHSIEGLQI